MARLSEIVNCVLACAVQRIYQYTLEGALKMAKPTLDLSKSIIRDDAQAEVNRLSQVSCRYLYHGRVVFGYPRSVALHAHPFWHVDVHVTGNASLLIRGGRMPIKAGAVYFIPAGVEHGFDYSRQRNDFLTLKVAVLGRSGQSQVLFAKPSPVVLGLRRALLEATPRDASPTRAQQETVELLAAALIAHCYPEQSAESPSPSIATPLVEGVRLFVSRSQGRVPSVKEVARHMGYSISHIASRFRDSEGVALKRYLDNERCRVASWLMVYSDLSVGEVADKLGFPDIYSFSRFFKRLTGTNPTEFRASALKRLSHDEKRDATLSARSPSAISPAASHTPS
jgi:AraC-like DNA-binding protein